MFNFGLYKEGLRKTRTLAVLFLAMMILGAVFQPIAEISNHMRAVRYGWQWEIQRGIRIAGINASFVMPFAVFLGAPLLTFSIFSFLNKRDSSDFFHAIPHKRETVFGSFIAAVVTWVIGGMWLGAAISVVIYALYPPSVIYFGSIVRVLIGLSAACLLMISAIVLAMSVTGKRLSNLIAALLILFFPRGIVSMFIMLITDTTRIVSFADFGIFGDVNQNIIIGMFSGMGYDINQVIMRGTLYTFVLAVFYFIVAGVLFKKRHSEVASHPSSRLTQQIIRIIFTFIITLPAIGILLSGGGQAFEAVMGAITFYLIAAIGYFAYEFVTSKKIPALSNMLPGIIVVAVLNVAFIFGVNTTRNAILQEINLADISSIEIVHLGAYDWGRGTPTYGELRAEGIVLTEDQVLQIFGESLNTEIERARMRLRGEFASIDWSAEPQREVRVTFHLESSRDVTSRVRIFADTLLDNEEYRALYLLVPEVPFEVSSWHGLTRDEALHVLDVLREELQEVDFMDWYQYVGPARWDNESLRYGAVTVSGSLNGYLYRSEFPMTAVTPRALALYLSYAENHYVWEDVYQPNIFEHYDGIYLGAAHEVWNLMYDLNTIWTWEHMTIHPDGITLISLPATPAEIVTTSAFVFTLVQNAEWMTFVLETGPITITQEQIAEFLGEGDFADEAELRELLEERFEDADWYDFFEMD